MADIADSFVGYSAGDGKRMKATLTSKHILVNEKGYTLHEVGYVELVVRISPVHLMFSWRTNFSLPLAGAEYCHPANFTCSILTRLPYAAYCE